MPSEHAWPDWDPDAAAGAARSLVIVLTRSDTRQLDSRCRVDIEQKRKRQSLGRLDRRAT